MFRLRFHSRMQSPHQRSLVCGLFLFVVLMINPCGSSDVSPRHQFAGASDPESKDPKQVRLEQEYQQIQRSQIETYLDLKLRESFNKRNTTWKRDFSSIENYERSIAPKRKAFVEYLGGFPYTPAPLDLRKEMIRQTPTHTAWRIRFRAFDEVEVYGILLVPDPERYPGKRPGLLCLHGMLGTPEDVCGIVDREEYHHRFGVKGVEQGYVVFAPLMINSPERREWLDRKGIMIGQRLQGLEQFKMVRAVDYLSQRDDVDASRIGVYGISWGGRTAMYCAAIDPRLICCVISGHFMESTRKMVQPREPQSYSTYIEAGHAYAFFSGQATEFADADVVSLICPRAVHIEQGRLDRVATWREAQDEFQLVREYYAKLGIEDRATFEIFEGNHYVAGEEAFEILAKHLQP